MIKKKLLEHLARAVGLVNPSTGNILNITIRPSKISRLHFLSIKNLQLKLNLLYYNLSKDLDSYTFDEPMYKFLHSIYTEKKMVKKDNIVALYIRSDYLLDGDQYKQVEINTISQCFVSFGPLLNKIHSLLYPNVEISDADKKFIDFIKNVKSIYESKNKIQDTIVVMVDRCTTIETDNYMEKAQLIKVFLSHGIYLHFVTIDELKIQPVENDKNNCSVFLDNKRVSIIYYRWFYNLDHFDEDTKKIRKNLELANVINLPSVELQMINSKLFQVVLSKKISLYTEDYKEISRFFGEFIANKTEFDKFSNNKSFKREEWLEKSVDEGGNSINRKKDGSIYMKKFLSPTVKNAFLKDCIEINMINEVSIFGSLIVLNGKVLFNEECGYIVRSKNEDNLEGGICSGNGGLDSIQFID